jgi:hypothetical protein
MWQTGGFWKFEIKIWEIPNLFLVAKKSNFG